MHQIYPIPAFSDNYIWAYIPADNSGQCFVVDPGDAKPVMTFLQERQLSLAAILVTHWHGDHIGGINDLLKTFDVPVYGPDSQHIPQVTHVLSEGDSINCLGINLNILAIPGHTLDHIAYFAPGKQDPPLVFCGDTLFAAGCGRMFEGDAPMMHQSLQKLASLPHDTRVYCTHEYTLANLTFALAVEPDNVQLQQRFDECNDKRQQNQCTLPSFIALELETNPFLRVQQYGVVMQALNQGAASKQAVDVFAYLRKWKDNF